ncbi:DNA-3-methyladenine glycosylase I [Balneolaceae bacterium YR4-1]|uniref:DNA-3-methyladenine glycosylase I n=1 Tax=Halalkalibaculum roseum TaxID=2709311 RepID=A0A6M1SXF9_9BACT|nr:DNA-3-methyladenine glycosylase I [Halalkalibaculum roseum]NGP75804.1 DNA-3-methyladenine glycosylase I [Halalkalibaculum roseum]
MKKRCDWCENTFDEYVEYHDKEWGVTVHDDKIQFEFLILEGAQAGLSWSTILKRREGYREAFANFDVEKVARFDEAKIQELLNNPAIIRNKLKVRSAVTNAQNFIELKDRYGSFDDYIWSFVDGEPVVNHWTSMSDVPATTEISDKLAKDLKKRGFKFVGSTIMYAHMQAVGMVNDHLVSCFRHKEIINMH